MTGSIARTWAQAGGGGGCRPKLAIITDLALPYVNVDRLSTACARRALEDFDVTGGG